MSESAELFLSTKLKSEGLTTCRQVRSTVTIEIATILPKPSLCPYVEQDIYIN